MTKSKCCYNVCEGLDKCNQDESKCTILNPACKGCARFKKSCNGAKKANFYYPEDCDGFTRKHRKDWHADGDFRSPYKHKPKQIQKEKPKGNGLFCCEKPNVVSFPIVHGTCVMILLVCHNCKKQTLHLNKVNGKNPNPLDFEECKKKVIEIKKNLEGGK